MWTAHSLLGESTDESITRVYDASRPDSGVISFDVDDDGATSTTLTWHKLKQSALEPN